MARNKNHDVDVPDTETDTSQSSTSGETKIRFGDIVVTVQSHYGSGHVCSAIEAAVLNQVRIENIRNNIRTRVRSADEKGEGAPDPAELQAYADEYSFATKASRGVGIDPVDTEERRLAALAVRAKMDQQGIKRSSIDKDTFNGYVDQVVAGGRFRSRAEAVVAERKAAREADLDIDLAA